jgi:hypothetical protein
VRLTGRRIDLTREGWLEGPVASLEVVDERRWLIDEALRLQAEAEPESPGAGLLHRMSLLDGPEFTAAQLAAPIRDFYEHTSRWRLDAWVGWAPLAWPAGWLLTTLFARRLRQLALPLRSLDLTHGMTSTVTPLRRDDHQVGAMWLRRLRSTGATVFSGLYSTVPLPKTGDRAVRVVFPLPSGRLVVLLTPRTEPSGNLILESTGDGWGASGAYLVVERGNRCWARQVPLHEVFHLYLDDEAELRTDHRLALGRIPILRLHYRLRRA